MWIRFATPFGRTESVLAILRAHLSFLDRRHHRVSVSIERRAIATI
jgi:hypothetical protein